MVNSGDIVDVVIELNDETKIKMGKEFYFHEGGRSCWKGVFVSKK